MAINGTLTHVIPLLTDRGVPPQQAAFVFSFAGYAIILGRILAGWCLDRFRGPHIAMFFFAVPIIGIALLGSGATGLAPAIGAVLCGVGIGAEIDLMAFLLSRYFGLKAYGKIYGVMFAVFGIGTGIGPALRASRSTGFTPTSRSSSSTRQLWSSRARCSPGSGHIPIRRPGTTALPAKQCKGRSTCRQDPKGR